MTRWVLVALLTGLVVADAHAQRAVATTPSVRSGDYAAAIRELRDALRRDPNRVDAARNLMRALHETGKYDEAIHVATEASSEVRLQLQSRLGEALMARGRWDEAERAFRAASDGGATDSLWARLQLALLAQRRGQHAVASSGFDRFIDVYNRSRRQLTSQELTAVATAVRYLGRASWELFHDATRAYQEAIDLDPWNTDAEFLLGELFLEKYNGTEARASFDAVLARNPNHAPALLGKAAALRFAGEPGSGELAEQSLAINEQFVPAHVFLALLHLETQDRVDARAAIERALRIDPRSLEALSVLAAIELAEGNHGAFGEVRQRVLALNPVFAEFYLTLADAAVRGRSYQRAVDYAHEAIRLDSLSWRAFSLLGINQLRRGIMDSGRANLERAFAGDPFDVWTKNTLDLLDTLDHYDVIESPHFRFVIDPGEAALLAPYAIDVAEQAYARFQATYRYVPSDPIRVEMFPTHGDFSVRTVGLVGMGALGVSFGPVIAMDAPAARQRSGERGERALFNWGSTLWHEIAHSFHLGASGYRVPRWFTEGLAVFEERRARPGWGEGPSPEFLIAYRENQLWPVSELENGFIRPKFPQQLLFSYYQASLVCELIARDHGDDAFRRMLAAYRGGATSDDVFRRVLGVSPDAFEQKFHAYVDAQFAGPLAALRGYGLEPDQAPDEATIASRAASRPGDFFAQLRQGRQLIERGRAREALPFLERARDLFPEYAGSGSPYWYLAVARTSLGDSTGAARELEALLERNAGDYRSAVELARLHEALGAPDAAARALDRAFYVFPYDAALHERLAALATVRGDWPLAIRERRALVALRPVDRAAALYRLAHAYFKGGDLQQARRSVLAALEIAPGYAEAQDLLLEIHAARPPGGW